MIELLLVDLIGIDQFIEYLANDTTPTQCAGPVHFRDIDAVGAEHELAGRGHTQSLARECQHLQFIDKGNGVGKIEIDMRVDGCKIGTELAIWIAFMQQHYLHRSVVRLLKYIAQMQGISQAHISIAVSIAGMELNWKLLFRCFAKGDMQQVIQERFVSDT